MDGNNDCMLYAYGGFNIPLLPNFSVSRLMYIQNMKGIYAMANLRGGRYKGTLLLTVMPDV